MNLKCPACVGKRQHTDNDWWEWHHLAGHGFTKEHGFSSEGARLAHEQDAINSSKDLIAPVLPAIGRAS